MSLDKLPVFISGEPGSMKARVATWIKVKIYNRLAKRTNWLQDRVQGESYEVIVEGNDPGDNGNWRLSISGDDLLVQKRISGAWSTSKTFAGS